MFATILERILHQVCLVNENPVSRTILAYPALYTIYAVFAAGIFEETGRLFGYKIMLRKNHNNSCAVAYGIGHGGCEVFILLGANYLMLLLAQLGVNLGGEEVNAQLIATANAISFVPACLGMMERLFAMMTQVGLSMLVFVAVWKKGLFWLYPVAIVLHALADVPAALYQYQVLTSLWVLEVVTFMVSVFCLVFGVRMLRKYGNPCARKLKASEYNHDDKRETFMIKNKDNLIMLFLTIVFCLSLTACNDTVEHEHCPQEDYPEDGEQEAVSTMNQMYVDRQGTDDIYSSMLIVKNDDDYAVEISLYRVGYLNGTAVESQGNFYFSGNHGVTGIICLEKETASFEVTGSGISSVLIGEKWLFPEVNEYVNSNPKSHVNR